MRCRRAIAPVHALARCQRGASRDARRSERVEGNPERVEISQWPAWFDLKRTVEEQRHATFREAAVRTQRPVKPRQVVIGGTRTEDVIAISGHDEVADAIRRQFEPAARVIAIRHRLDAGDRRQQPDDGRPAPRIIDIRGRKGTQRPVVRDIWVRNRQDDRGSRGADPLIEQSTWASPRRRCGRGQRRRATREMAPRRRQRRRRRTRSTSRPSRRRSSAVGASDTRAR